MEEVLRVIDIFLGRILSVAFEIFPSNKRIKTPAIRKILLIKLWGLGNLTIIWPLVYKIREKYPTSSIYFLTFDLNKGFLERNQVIDRILYFKFTKNIFRIITQFISLTTILRKERIDLVINFETFNNTSALFSYLTGAPLRIGINNRYEKVFYNYSVDNYPSLHISEVFLKLLKPLSINSPYTYYCFSDGKKEQRRVDNILRSFGIEKFILIHPGTSENFKGKRWKSENFAELADLLIEKYNLPIIFTGTEKEKPLIMRIIENISSKDSVFNTAGMLSIWEFIELLKKSMLFISNDTGPVHIVASLKGDIATFYGPTSPHRYRPLNRNSITFYRQLECSPCVGISYINSRCKNNFRCMNFSPHEVFLEISERFFQENP
ncbi:MAG TPA: glycosyltransferase family 9 protein [Candidatus Omnitrophica bacterium]|nr:glycosyltransferase family 9 protein [Candidatus Omnitrophota bacterium]